MEFRKLSIKNFFSIGEDGIELDFSDLSGIVLVSGKNLDIGEGSSNGSGKSLLIEAILWALYGKTLRGLSKNEVINNLNQKRCKVVVEVDDLRIERSRKPNKLRVFRSADRNFTDETEISLSTMPRTDELIQQIIGIDYTTFCNIFCFGQHNLFSFISADEKTRREIVEDLLSLSDYNLCLENTRAAIRSAKSSLREEVAELKVLDEQLTSHKNSKISYERESARQSESLQLEIRGAEKQIEELSGIDSEGLIKEWDRYDRAKAEISKVMEEVSRIGSEVKSRHMDISIKTKNIKKIDEELGRIEALKPGVKCDRCFSEVDPSNAEPLRKQYRAERENLISEAEKIGKRLTPLLEEEKSLREHLSSLKQMRPPDKTRKFLNRIQVEVERNKAIVREKREQLKKNIYLPLIEKEVSEISELEKRITKLRSSIEKKEDLLKYLKFWEHGFGPEGIRSFVVHNVVGFINTQVNYWLQFLIDRKIQVHFDKFLNVSITRASEEDFSYKQGSGGEKRRIDLAISLAFADLMRISNNAHNNIIFLDEVVDSLDFSGVNGVYDLISELSKNKIVCVITHNPILLNQLNCVPKLKMIKKDGFSTMELN